jgi:hypothetical protein
MLELGTVLADTKPFWTSLNKLHAAFCKRLNREVEQSAPHVPGYHSISECLRAFLPQDPDAGLEALQVFYSKASSLHRTPQGSGILFPLAAVLHCPGGSVCNAAYVVAGALPHLRGCSDDAFEDSLHRHLVSAVQAANKPNKAQAGAQVCQCRAALAHALMDPVPWHGDLVAAAKLDPYRPPEPVVLAANSKKCPRQRVVELYCLTNSYSRRSAYTGCAVRLRGSGETGSDPDMSIDYAPGARGQVARVTDSKIATRFGLLLCSKPALARFTLGAQSWAHGLEAGVDSADGMWHTSGELTLNLGQGGEGGAGR